MVWRGPTWSRLTPMFSHWLVLNIGVNRDHVGPLQTIEYDPIEHAQTSTANAYNLDRNKFLFAFGQTVIFPELNHLVVPMPILSPDSPLLSFRAICQSGSDREISYY